MKYINLLLVFCLVYCSTVFADYQMRSLGGLVSDDEHIIDSSSNGWVLVRDGHDKRGCVTRLKISSKQVDRLCNHGIRQGVAINSHGHVLGTGNNKRPLIWKGYGKIKYLEKARKPFSDITLTDLNDHDLAIGFATHLENTEDNYFLYSTSFLWNRRGKLNHIRPPKGVESSTIYAWSINNSGEMVVQISPEKMGYVYKRGRKGNYILVAKNIYSNNFSINDRGQISINSYIDYLYSPKTGLREVNSNPNNMCGRCDYDTYTAIANDGRAIFHDGTSLTLSDYPHSAVPLTCLMPQNRRIINTNRLISEIDLSSLQVAKLLEDERILLSANINGDGKEQQLFIIEKKEYDNNAGVYNYCIDLKIDKDASPISNCSEPEPGDKLINCSGSISVSSFSSNLPPISISMYARQIKDSSEIICQENFVRTFQISNPNSKILFKEILDPGFEYFFDVDDPRFVVTRYSEIFNPVYEVPTPIMPCRAPFEGL